MTSDSSIAIKGEVYIHCMFCGETHHPRDMYARTGVYDVCKDSKCIKALQRTRKNKAKSNHKNNKRLERGENGLPITWMNGEF